VAGAVALVASALCVALSIWDLTTRQACPPGGVRFVDVEALGPVVGAIGVVVAGVCFYVSRRRGSTGAAIKAAAVVAVVAGSVVLVADAGLGYMIWWHAQSIWNNGCWSF
jgi:hypothetical protein